MILLPYRRIVLNNSNNFVMVSKYFLHKPFITFPTIHKTIPATHLFSICFKAHLPKPRNFKLLIQAPTNSSTSFWGNAGRPKGGYCGVRPRDGTEAEIETDWNRYWFLWTRPVQRVALSNGPSTS
ncbi:uncharacterized protein LOC129870869 isoform X2 [Solanum dulcamara]|uniref:uncharacterized protein LOC129870869 isoform X2 n=1 Tax=Solanum dulcamara TaxID=45834 RepID=UPI0024862EDD|nr:uncharacterized protein LOC129870869 isoform X2 [Solanum dulcamara]